MTPTLEAQMLWDSLSDASKLALYIRASSERDRLVTILKDLDSDLDFAEGVPADGRVRYAFPEMLTTKFAAAKEVIR